MVLLCFWKFTTFIESERKKSKCTYGRIIFCKKLFISLLLTDRFTFKFPAGLTTEKYVLKHCNGLPSHGPTENDLFIFTLRSFWWQFLTLLTNNLRHQNHVSYHKDLFVIFRLLTFWHESNWHCCYVQQ